MKPPFSRTTNSGLPESLKGQIIVSTQILNEFSNVLIRHKIDDDKIQYLVGAIIEECDICPVDLKTVERAWHIRIKYQFSYWDSLIVASALGMNCSVLYTEDLQHNQIIEEKLKITNPYQIRNIPLMNIATLVSVILQKDGFWLLFTQSGIPIFV